MESGEMFVFLLPETGQMFAQERPLAPGMFAWGFLFFRDILPAIARFKSEHEYRISRIRAKVGREFPERTLKRAPVA
jgi:hypothetical protein